MVQALYIVTLISSAIGGLVLIFGSVGAKSSPQEAAAAAIGIGLAVIPYVFARCVQISRDRAETMAVAQRTASALEDIAAKLERKSHGDNP
ncbi:MAG: hypothetical protein KIS62_01350 [Ramlibacter sp.]|nr:hypothetical protein [Ramlibacter sp.]